MRACPVVAAAVPNWTAWRFKFRRSRRLKLVAGLVILALVWTVNQMIAAALRPDPSATTSPLANETVPGGQVEVVSDAPAWRVGDHWVWEDGHGLRVKDTVLDTSRDRSGILLYHVERESSMSDGRKPRVETLIYDSRLLAVRSVTYADGTTLEWRQRTLGLLDDAAGKGYEANATIDRPRSPDGRVLRIANVTSATDSFYRSPAGTFATRLVQLRFVDYDLQDPERSQIVEFAHWWSDDVANDVAFTLPNSTPEQPRILRLVGYRSVGGNLAPPPVQATPTWRTGFTWTYVAQDQARRVLTVTDAKAGVITVDRRELGGQFEVFDVWRYRARDLAPVSYTFGGAPFEISPHGVPLVPELGDSVLAYTKSVESAWGQRDFPGNATVRVQEGARVETPAGAFDALRIDVTERERSEEGEQIPESKTIRFYAPAVGNDVKVYESSGRIWELVSYSYGVPPWRWDSAPPPT